MRYYCFEVMDQTKWSPMLLIIVHELHYKVKLLFKTVTPIMACVSSNSLYYGSLIATLTGNIPKSTPYIIQPLHDNII